MHKCTGVAQIDARSKNDCTCLDCLQRVSCVINGERFIKLEMFTIGSDEPTSKCHFLLSILAENYNKKYKPVG